MRVLQFTRAKDLAIQTRVLIILAVTNDSLQSGQYHFSGNFCQPADYGLNDVALYTGAEINLLTTPTASVPSFGKLQEVC
jgi:hypothetical protein